MLNEQPMAVDVNTPPNRLISDMAIDNLKIASDIEYKCDLIARQLCGVETPDNEKEEAITGLKQVEETINKRLTTIINKLDYILSIL